MELARPRAFRASRLQVMLTEEEWRRFSEAAERRHLSLSAWIRLAALDAIETQHRPNVGATAVKALGIRGTQLQIRLTEDEKRLFSEAAAAQRLNVSEWIRAAGSRAAQDRPAHQTKFMPVWK